MPDESEQEAKLRKLGKRLERGWAKLHPVSEATLASVRQVVHQQWEKEQHAVKPTESIGLSNEEGKKQDREPAQELKSRSNRSRKPSHGKSSDQGHDQGH